MTKEKELELANEYVPDGYHILPYSPTQSMVMAGYFLGKELGVKINPEQARILYMTMLETFLTQQEVSNGGG